MANSNSHAGARLDEVRMVSASGILGYGFPEASLKAALERKPHMIGVDGGSSDPGPHYLGSGKTLNSRLAMKRDLSLLLRGAIANGIPMMVGTCGGAGGEPHLQALRRYHPRDRARARSALQDGADPLGAGQGVSQEPPARRQVPRAEQRGRDERSADRQCRAHRRHDGSRAASRRAGGGAPR